MDSVESLVAYCQQNRRVCPQPQHWNELWEILPNRTRVGAGWQPSLPLILGAWWDTTSLQEMLRLREHIEWADKHGAFHLAREFLTSLPESEWFHLGG